MDFFKKKNSGNVAKDRLKLLLISDRADCSPDVMENIKNDIIQGTVFNDRQGQAEQIARLATDLFKGNALSGYDFVNERYIFLPYQKVTISNVDTFMNR